MTDTLTPPRYQPRVVDWNAMRRACDERAQSGQFILTGSAIGVRYDTIAVARSLLIISQNRGISVAKPQVRDLRVEGKRHYSAVS